MASSNHGCYSSVTVNRHSIAGTPSLDMAYMPLPLQTLVSYHEPIPSWLDLDHFFFFSHFNNGDSIAEAESLPTMEDSDEELWPEALWNHSVPLSPLQEPNLLSTCSNYDMNAISSDDLSSSISGSVPSDSQFSSFSPLSPTISFNSQFQPDSSFFPLPTTSTNTHSTLQKQARKQSHKEEKEEEAVTFIVKGHGNALYDGYSWRKYGEKSIKHRAYPRSYYRCGHDGCKVKKQVEQSTENPLEFHVTYYGRHNHSAITDFSSIGYNQMSYQIGNPYS